MSACIVLSFNGLVGFCCMTTQYGMCIDAQVGGSQWTYHIAINILIDLCTFLFWWNAFLKVEFSG